MNTYKKRIAILWTTYSLKDNNGVYHFTRSLLKIAKNNNWKIDIIFDKKSELKGKNSYNEFESLGARLVFPKQTISDSTQKYYSFTAGISFIEMANLQSALLEALQVNLYDLIICEPMFASIIPQLSSIEIPVLWYTHHPGCITGDYNDGFTNNFLFNYLDKICKHSIIGTQTEYNNEILKARGIESEVLPLPFPDLEIFQPSSIEKRGILFCGTTEKRKHFRKFFDLIVKTRLPAKIMTSEKSGEKMLKMFNDAGITDVEIKTHILGKEKRDFFASSRIFFTPSSSESFGYAFAEAMPHTHAVALDYSWTKNFDKQFCHIIPDKNYIEYIEELYNSNPSIPAGAMDYVKGLHELAETKWVEFLNREKPVKKFSTISFIDKERNFWLDELSSILKRPLLTLDEINPLLDRYYGSGLHITYTDDSTWVSIDNSPIRERVTDIFDSIFGE